MTNCSVKMYTTILFHRGNLYDSDSIGVSPTTDKL